MSSDPILHVKDSYYFDVPKFMWQYDFTTLDDVPKFLREGHPEIKNPKVFAEALKGKILIPQPFGELKNLYQPASGVCVSRNMVLELFVAAVLCVLLIGLARRTRSGDQPRGKLWNFLEVLVLFVRDQVARPAIGHGADRFVPLLWTLFFFVLGMNLIGLVPWTGAPTASFAVTLTLACVTLLTSVVCGSLRFGVVGFWLHQSPHLDLPWYFAPIKWLIFVIEIFGLFVKHGVLAIRLLATMLAGHLVLLSILGMAFSLQMASNYYGWPFVAATTIFAGAVFDVLELFFAFLQAYIFTFLSALFIGMAVHGH